MKKTLALLLAVLTVFSSMVFAVAAEDATGTTTAKAKFVVIPDNSYSKNGKQYGWSGDGKTFAYHSDEGYMECSVDAYSIASPGAIKMMYKLEDDQTYDISEMKYLCFDLYIEDVAAVCSCNWELELRSPGAGDNHEYVITGKSLFELANGMLVNGWNHFQISLADTDNGGLFTATHKDGETDYDSTKWNYFRLFNCSTQPVGTNQNTKLKIKNLYFTDTAVAEKTTEGELYFGVKSENAYISNKDDYIHTYIEENTDPGKCLKMTTNAYVDNDKSKIDKNIKKNDIREYNYLVFDVMIEAAVLNKVSFCFELTSNGGSDTYEDSANKTLSDIAGKDLKANEWYRLYLPLSWFTTTNEKDGKCDRENWNFFRIFNNGVDNLDANNDTKSNYDITFSGFHFAEAIEPNQSEILVWDMEDRGVLYNGEFEQSSAYTPNDPLFDIDTDSSTDTDKEWVLVNQTATEGRETMYPLGGYGGNNAGIKGAIHFKNAIDMHSKFTGIKFDIYVSDTTTKTVTVGGRNDKGDITSSTTATSGTSILNQSFWIEITSSGVCDKQEKSWKGTLKELFGGEFTLGQWNTVTLNFDKALNTSNVSSYSDDDLAFNPQRANYIRIYNDSGFEWEGTLTIAIDNLYAVRDLGDGTANNASAKVSGAALALTDAFELNYTVATESIVSEPIMDVTFRNKTERVQLSADETGKYTYTFGGILPQYLVEEIKTTVYALDQNGGLLESTHTYSVEDYCAKMLGKTNTDLSLSADQKSALDQLLSDVLRYGAAAQTYIDPSAGNLATDGVALTGETKTYTKVEGDVIKLTVSTESTESSYKWGAATLVLGNTMFIRYYFTGEGTPTIKCTDANVGTYQGTFGTGKVDERECQYVDLPVYAGDFGTPYTLYFDDDASYTVTYSVNCYIASTYDGEGTNENLKSLLAAIYYYGTSVAAYRTAMTSSSGTN